MINKIFALPVNETISPVISRRQLDDLELIVIDHPQVKASVALQGAHLLSWKPAGEEEVLWLSNNTPFKQGVALRGGVPICWPWFGPSAQQGLPSHGFARNLPWTLEGHDEDDSCSIFNNRLKLFHYTIPALSKCFFSILWPSSAPRIPPTNSSTKPTYSIQEGIRDCKVFAY